MRTLTGFLPRSAPYLSRRPYALELTATFFFSIALASIDSGVMAVYAKQTFEGVVNARSLNFAVALLGTMDALANILSFVWSGLAQGRRKVPFINALQVVVILCIGAIAMMPQTSTGLALLMLGAIIARSCWSGILTVRPTVWRANYPREVRATIVGRFSIVQVIVIASGAALLGWVLDVDRSWHRPAVLAACVLGLFAVGATARIGVRREREMLRHEQDAAPAMTPWRALVVVWRVLHQDRRYAQFMACMFVLGFGNLMINPLLAITLRDQFGLDFFHSILITTTIQQGAQVLAIPAWGRLLDRTHIVGFRSVHAWCFTVSGTILVLGVVLDRVELMYIAAVVLGLAYAGGTLAWHLGHVDFAPPSETSHYMATHVTLNGVRGLLAPLTAVSMYEALRAAGASAAAWSLGVSLVVSISGAAGFTLLRRSMEREMISMKRQPTAGAAAR